MERFVLLLTKKALELIDEKYAPSRYNIYPFHFSDGENFYSDNTESVRLVKEIVALSNMFGYGEVNAYDRYSTLMRAFKEIDNPIFKRFVLKNKSDVYKAMKHYFQKKVYQHNSLFFYRYTMLLHNIV